jgi:hypothetical protein
MSLWTPDGERPVDAGDATDPEDAGRAEAMVRELTEARQRLLDTPVATVLANHALGIYELAAIHLTAERPKLAEAQLAIDALSGLLDATAGRLGEAESTAHEALHQARLAFVARSSETAGQPPPADDPRT